MRSIGVLSGIALLAAVTASCAQVPSPAPAKPLSIVVFSDFQCPFSADLFFSLQRYEKAHPGQLHVTFKQSPLNVHPGSPLAHRAALAAGRQGKFDAMAELLYANEKKQTEPDVISYARQLHLDPVRFKRDLNSASVAKELSADLDESVAFDINSTPTMYIAGKSLIGEQSDQTLAAAIAAAASTQDGALAPVPDHPAADPALMAAMQHAPSAEQGPANAPLTIVEFTDFQCPFCKMAAQPMEQFMAAHGREVHWVLRSFPLDFHPDSELANEAALAAGEQGKFWQMHDLLFAHQEALKLPNLRSYAMELSLDMQAFDEALSTHRLAGKIAADRALGMKAGVDGTPTFYIDGQEMSGTRSVAELEQILAQHQIRPSGGQSAVVAAAPVPEPERRVSGPDKAALTLTWYTDVRSPLAAIQAELIRSLAKRYDGKIRVIAKIYPLESHPDSRLAGAALVAAFAQNKFWPMYDALTAHKDGLNRAGVLALAEELKLNRDVFLSSLDAAGETVQADLEDAHRRGILGTPVIFLNTKRVDGLQRETFYTAIADEELKQSSNLQVQNVAPPKSAP